MDVRGKWLVRAALVFAFGCSHPSPSPARQASPANTEVAFDASAPKKVREDGAAEPAAQGVGVSSGEGTIRVDDAPKRTENGCGIRIEEPTATDATGKASQLEGCHTLSFAWRPWWLAPDPTAAPHRLMVGVDAVSRNLEDRGWRAWVSVRHLQPGESADSPPSHEIALFPATLFMDENGEQFVHGRFEDAALAKRMGLPNTPAGEPTSEFTFSLGTFAGHLWGQFSTPRNQIECTVLQLAPELGDPDCRPVVDDFTVEATKVGLDTPVTRSFKPRAMLSAIKRIERMTIDWGDEVVLDPPGTPRSSPVTLRVTSRGYACRAPFMFSSSRYSDTAFPVLEEGHQVMVPAEFELRSDDGRLDVRLPGRLHAWVHKGAAWDGHVELASPMVEVHALLAAGRRVGFELTNITDAFLSFGAHVGPEEYGVSQLSLQAFERDSSAPPFPGVSEYASNRASCFGALPPSLRREAHLLTR